MFYQYTPKKGGLYIIQSPVHLTEKEQREVERTICAASSTDCTTFCAPEKEAKNAPVD